MRWPSASPAATTCRALAAPRHADVVLHPPVQAGQRSLRAADQPGHHCRRRVRDRPRTWTTSRSARGCRTGSTGTINTARWKPARSCRTGSKARRSACAAPCSKGPRPAPLSPEGTLLPAADAPAADVPASLWLAARLPRRLGRPDVPLRAYYEYMIVLKVRELDRADGSGTVNAAKASKAARAAGQPGQPGG